MSNKIFYFSGTGNTLHLAKKIAESAGDTELVRITPDMDFDQRECTSAGIAYPVYCFGLPNIISHFVEKVQFSQNTYIFGLASYGGLLTNSGNILKKKLRSRGYTLAAGFAVQLPGNAQMVYEVIADNKALKMNNKKDTRIPEIAAAIRGRKTAPVETNLSILGKAASLLSPGMMAKMPETAKSFYVDEKCNGCGICTQVCIKNNVSLDNKKPKWGNNCECCLACFHWCPQQSIQANKKTTVHKRYHHPAVSLDEIRVKQAT